MQTVLVGLPNTHKDSAINVPVNLLKQEFPTVLLSGTMQSPEDSIAEMAGPQALVEFIQTYTDEETGEVKTRQQFYRRFMITNSELSDYLSRDFEEKKAFLLKGFDSPYLKTGFKKDKQNGIPSLVENPFITLLGGVQPSWFMDNMRADLFDSGLGRRWKLINCNKTKDTRWPHPFKDSLAGWKRVIRHLHAIANLNVEGECILTTEAKKWWDWYYDEIRLKREKNDNKLIAMIEDIEKVEILRLSIILCFCDYVFELKIHPYHLDMARNYLEALKPGIQELTGGSGANQMAAIIYTIKTYMQQMQAVDLDKLAGKFMHDCPKGLQGFYEVLDALATEGFLAHDPDPRDVKKRVVKKIAGITQKDKPWIVTQTRYETYVAEGKIRN